VFSWAFSSASKFKTSIPTALCFVKSKR